MGDTKTLRDEFAMAALPQAMADASHWDGVAKTAYRIADDMLAERKKKHQEPQGDADGFFNTDDEKPNETGAK